MMTGTYAHACHGMHCPLSQAGEAAYSQHRGYKKSTEMK